MGLCGALQFLARGIDIFGAVLLEHRPHSCGLIFDVNTRNNERITAPPSPNSAAAPRPMAKMVPTPGTSRLERATSDGGLLLVRELDERLGLSRSCPST